MELHGAPHDKVHEVIGIYREKQKELFFIFTFSRIVYFLILVNTANGGDLEVFYWQNQKKPKLVK